MRDTETKTKSWNRQTGKHTKRDKKRQRQNCHRLERDERGRKDKQVRGRTQETCRGQRQRKGVLKKKNRQSQVNQSLEIEIVQFWNFGYFFWTLSGNMLCQIKYIECQVLSYELFILHLCPLKQRELKRLFEVQKRPRVKINVCLENVSIPLLPYKADPWKGKWWVLWFHSLFSTWLLIKIPLSLTLRDHWVSEESFWKPKRNSTEEKLVQSQYNGTRINMIRRDRGSHLWWITSNAENPCAFFRGPCLMLIAYRSCPRSCLHDWNK